ncbi:unnamed protein product [Calypogeia fissa]
MSSLQAAGVQQGYTNEGKEAMTNSTVASTTGGEQLVGWWAVAQEIKGSSRRRSSGGHRGGQGVSRKASQYPGWRSDGSKSWHSSDEQVLNWIGSREKIASAIR